MTGFVLIGHFRLTAINNATGLLLIMTGFVFLLSSPLKRRRLPLVVGVSAMLALVGLTISAASAETCDVDTPYYCLRLCPTGLRS